MGRGMVHLFLGFLLVFVFCEKKTEFSARKAAPEAKKSGLNDVCFPGAKLEKVTIGYEFDTAGSPCYADDVLYFTNNNFDKPEKSRVITMDAQGTYSVIRPNNGVTTSIISTGTGNFYCCEMLGHRVIEIDRNGKVLRVAAGEYNGKRIDGPNDMVLDRKGGLYFTDSQFIAGKPRMQETPAVYYVKPDGAVIRIIDDIEFPNGVDLSPDGKTLYVANTRGVYILAYDVLDNGTVTNGRNFTEVELTPENIESGESGADGMVVDSAGNLYVATTKGLGIQVFNSRGEKLGNISCPTPTNNCCFGGEDLKTLYVSAKDGIYKIPVKIPGL